MRPVLMSDAISVARVLIGLPKRKWRDTAIWIFHHARVAHQKRRDGHRGLWEDCDGSLMSAALSDRFGRACVEPGLGDRRYRDALRVVLDLIDEESEVRA